MEIKRALFSDIPRIVSLLKASLGDELPVSEEIWKYKHMGNTFGESIVLLAEENGKLAGVRAFMRWKWQKGEKIYSCLRAVDTATHPDFRGRGIFKQLTLKAVEIAKNAGDHFVFNTPNDQSRPGYLKMGWRPAGQIQVCLKPALGSFWKIWKNGKKYTSSGKKELATVENLLEEWNNVLVGRNEFFTPKSAEYLHWRYEVNPLQEYQIHVAKDLFIAGCVRKKKGLKELRIVELIFSEKNPKQATIKGVLKEWSNKFGVQVISYAPKLFKFNKPVIQGAFGPILTVRELNLLPEERELPFNVDHWSYVLGDLELF